MKPPRDPAAVDDARDDDTTEAFVVRPLTQERLVELGQQARILAWAAAAFCFVCGGFALLVAATCSALR